MKMSNDKALSARAAYAEQKLLKRDEYEDMSVRRVKMRLLKFRAIVDEFVSKEADWINWA